MKFKKILLHFIVIIVIIITFFNQYSSLIEDIETTAKSKEAQINRQIDLSKGFIDLITIYGNDYLKHNVAKDAELYRYLKYNTASNSYNLDAIEGTNYQQIAGNLTGIGKMPESGIYREEINLALHLNQNFSSIYNKMPDVAWLYYTSENNFINIYPWTKSKDFSFKEDLKAEKFYTYVTPENDPLRESVWTPVYLDHAGKGLMVTLSSPIYNANTFMGVVSLDFTNKQLSEIIKSNYEAYIIDDTDSVMATSTDMKFDKDVIKFDSVLNTTSDNVKKIKEINSNQIKRLGDYYIYAVAFDNAPWKMYVRVPVSSVVGKAALYSLPILIICSLLIFTFIEVEKRKKTEVQLKKSLYELTSYQKKLEDAAKYDFLTATVNRRGLIDIFNNNIERETNNPVFFIMGDIDHFKKFNDIYGHAAGDKVLMEIARIMQRNIRNNDVVCRWGGEEFIIMLLDRKYDEALLIAENIRKEIESTVIPWDNSQELKATMTFGVAEHDYGDSIESSISKADAAMYIGKGKGRNQVVDYLDCEIS